MSVPPPVLPPPSCPPPGYEQYAAVGAPVRTAAAPSTQQTKPKARAVLAAAATKAAEPTVKKILPATQNPGLKALVPASVRIRREQAAQPPSKRPRVLNTAPEKKLATPAGAVATGVTESDIDSSYLSFLDDMRDLGAFDK